MYGWDAIVMMVCIFSSAVLRLVMLYTCGLATDDPFNYAHTHLGVAGVRADVSMLYCSLVGSVASNV